LQIFANLRPEIRNLQYCEALAWRKKNEKPAQVACFWAFCWKIGKFWHWNWILDCGGVASYGTWTVGSSGSGFSPRSNRVV